MSIAASAMPGLGLIGGLLIGLAATILLLGAGRIAGVSGLAARAAGLAATGAPWRVAAGFVAGLPAGAALVGTIIDRPIVSLSASPGFLIAGGLLVGLGTRIGGGCTSGHGVCGMARLSPRSLVATMVFMTAGIVTVAIMNRIELRP